MSASVWNACNAKRLERAGLFPRQQITRNGEDILDDDGIELILAGEIFSPMVVHMAFKQEKGDCGR
jgi:hypothetical protein